MDRINVAMVVPAFNEKNTIREVIQKAQKFGTVIVVDDCSSDGTKEIAESLSATVVRHENNKGYEESINTGFKLASEMGCSHVITLDADGQHDPDLLECFMNELKKGNELVLGVRDKLPRLSEKAFALYTGWKFGVVDPCCGMKAYRIEIYNKRGCFDSYGSIGTELALNAVSDGRRFSEVLFKVNERDDESRFGNMIKGNWKIFKAIFKTIIRFSK